MSLIVRQKESSQNLFGTKKMQWIIPWCGFDDQCWVKFFNFVTPTIIVRAKTPRAVIVLENTHDSLAKKERKLT